MREKVIAEYHELLAADKNLSAEFFARLREQMHERRLCYGTRPLGVALRPHFLTARQYNKLTDVSEYLAGAFEKIVRALVAEPALTDKVGLPEREQRLALVEPGFAYSGVTTRLDAFVRGDDIKFVEYNGENTSSLTDQEGLNDILFETPALQSLARRYNFRRFDPAEKLLETLLVTFKEWNGGGNRVPQIAIVDWANLPTENEFILLQEYFAARNIPTIICAPDELEFDGEHLRRGDFQIDLVYKRVIIHELLARCDDSHPLLRAYVEKKVCVVNPFRCKIAHKKAAFEILTNEDYAGWFSAAERETIAQTIPWTRRVFARRTEFKGEKVDLLEFIRQRRADFILKPNDDYGGQGICLGHRASESEWEQMIETAVAGDYVVQQIIELQTEDFPVFGEQNWGFQPMFVDTNPFLFSGTAEGALVRLSLSPVVNVTIGGGETGFVVIDED